MLAIEPMLAMMCLAMKLTLDSKRKKLVIELDLLPEARPSSTGRSVVIADTINFVKGDATIAGKQVAVKAIAIIPNR